jgi:hypothetical protein
MAQNYIIALSEVLTSGRRFQLEDFLSFLTSKLSQTTINVLEIKDNIDEQLVGHIFDHYSKEP